MLKHMYVYNDIPWFKTQVKTDTCTCVYIIPTVILYVHRLYTILYGVHCVSVCQELLRDGQSLEEQVKIDLATEDHDSHIYDSLHPTTTSPVGSPFHSNGVQVSCVHVCTLYMFPDPLLCSRMTFLVSFLGIACSWLQKRTTTYTHTHTHTHTHIHTHTYTHTHIHTYTYTHTHTHIHTHSLPLLIYHPNTSVRWWPAPCMTPLRAHPC